MAATLWVLGVLAVACVLTGWLTVAGWRNRNVVGADWFAATMGVTTLWTAVAIADALVRSVTGQVLAALLGTTAAVAVPVLWFSFVVEYTGRGHVLSRRGLAALWAVPVAAYLLILAAPVSDLYFRAWRDADPGPGVVLESTPGPVAWLNLAYAVVLLAAGLWLVARMLWDHDRLYSGQALGLLAGSLAPVALLGPAVADVLPPEVPGIALGFSVLGVGYGYSLFAHRLLELSPASRRIGVPEAFDDLGEGVVVAGTGGDVVELNQRARELFDCRNPDALGSPIEAVSPSLASLGREPRTADVRRGSRVLSVSVSAVRDARDRRTGTALVVRDVTRERRRKQRLEVLNRVFRHNIRNSMNAVVGPADMLAGRVDEGDRELAETVTRAGREILDLAESIRDIEETVTRPLDPTAVEVDRVAEDCVGDAPASVETTLTCSGDCTVRTDSRTLSLALRNAVDNAVEHGATTPRSQAPEDADERSSSGPASQAQQDAVEHSSTSPDSQARRDAVEHSSTSHADADASADADGASSVEPSVADAPEDAVEHGSTTPSAPDRPDDGDAADSVSVTVERREGGCLVLVEDDGPGIPEEELDVLRAGTETPLSHGSGVGLWAIRWGVARVDGAVGFDTDDGTTVALWVPDLPDEDAAKSAAGTPPETPGIDWFGATEPTPVAAIDDSGEAAASDDRADD